ncbi:MAG: single-stranded-DNA-specific exonuclease RecJ, partial [Candidatus Omnitrophica bacterium]|nr:single-stranded-DNA-specific exonuclease RecJ [Candidatus Omnitrophota bacterium]
MWFRLLMHANTILSIAPPQPELRKKISEELGISDLIAQLLLNRGIDTAEEAERFLNPDASHLLEPFQFSEMKLAVNYILKAIKHRQKIMVAGDYDVDGVTALAVLKHTLGNLGADVI